MVRSAIRAILKSAAFIVQDAEWTINKLIGFNGFPEEGVQAFHRAFTDFSKDGKVDVGALENVRNFLTQCRLTALERRQRLVRCFLSSLPVKQAGKLKRG